MNTIGERIRQARTAAGLSLRQLAETIGVSAQAISKYERGLDTPGSDVLLRLADALGVRYEYFFRRVTLGPVFLEFRKRARFGARAQERLEGQIRDWLERYLEAESLVLPPERGFRFPSHFPREVATFDEVEEAADALREAWSLGGDAIENVTELLEDHEVKVWQVESDPGFDACLAAIPDRPELPAAVVRKGVPGDRMRMSLAHELGHLVLRPKAPLDPERAASRFGGAFLVPREAAFRELGARRTDLDFYELHLLKHKYGVSMKGWVYRARDLGIISEQRARGWFIRFSKYGKEEPGDPCRDERPLRLERLVLHARAEGLISESRAGELLGMPWPEFCREAALEHDNFPVGRR
jgi:transcriptional regulator with XRE-family HTH domain